MILHTLACVETGQAGLLDDLLKITIIGVAQYFGQIPTGPVIIARIIFPSDFLKWRFIILRLQDSIFICHIFLLYHSLQLSILLIVIFFSNARHLGT